MIVHIKRLFLLLWIFCIPVQIVFSQHSTWNNYTGDWESSESWNPAWTAPLTITSGGNITINGYITVNNSLSFTNSASNLIINDTLVIKGDLLLENNNDLTINNSGILIIRGKLTIHNETKITANGYLIITGNIDKHGSDHHGSFTSDDNPAKVFIGGTNNVGNNESNYSVLNCPAKVSTPYPDSHCSYGNMTDITNDPVFSFFQSTYIMVTTTATPGTVCAGTEVQLVATVSGGSGSYTYSWTSIPAGFTSSIADPVVSPVVNTTYNISVFDGVATVNSNISVTVNPLPVTPTVTAGGPTTLCAGGSVTLISDEGTSYLWSNDATSQSINITVAGGYTVQVTNAYGCQSALSEASIVVVNELPLVNITSSSSSMCLNDMRTLTGSPAGGTFSISDGPGTISGNVLSATGTGNISLEYKYTGVCSNKALQSIVVNDKPVAIPGPDQELKYVFETLMAAELSEYETGEWSLISGSGHIGDIHSPASVVTDLSAGENIFLWKVQNGSCEAGAEVKITVYDLFVPSVITPDGDGLNDYFKISETNGQVELIIFNRWGNKEYTNSNYLNDWDGRNIKGAELPNDTYFYVLILEDGKVKKGSVLIKR
jgi:gliding motility-associated-like protein